MERAFGSALRAIRRGRGISQRQLAEAIGVDFSYISKIENDRLPPPSGETIVKIAEALGTSAEQLLAQTGKMPDSLRDSLASSCSALQFLREAQEMELSEGEWERLGKSLKRLRRES